MVHKKYSLQEIALGALGGLLTIFILTFYLWHLTENIRFGYATTSAEKEIQSLQEDLKSLEAKKASLLRLERVERIAKERLKLSEPREDQIIIEKD
jgi:cell division protein FtsL